MKNLFSIEGRVALSPVDSRGIARCSWAIDSGPITSPLSCHRQVWRCPFFAQRVSADPAVVWLVGFYGATMLIFTMYGGGFATIPAYLADVFGTRYVGGIHGRLLTAWSTAGADGHSSPRNLHGRNWPPPALALSRLRHRRAMRAPP